MAGLLEVRPEAHCESYVASKAIEMERLVDLNNGQNRAKTLMPVNYFKAGFCV
jgi:hypothetical protein